MQNEDVTFKGLFLPLTTKKIIIFIFIIGLIVFSSSLFNGFVGDDDSQIIKNVSIRQLTNIPAFFTSSTFYNGSDKLIGVYYKPLLTTVFAIEYTLFGPNALPFHFVQIIFHILNSCILFLFLNRFFKKAYSFLLSLVFLVHPINSEAVFYISAMQEVLFFFFGILAIKLTTKVKSRHTLILIFLFFLLSLFSKETGLLFIFMSLVYVFLFNKKQLIPIFTLSSIAIIFYLILRTYSVGLLQAATSSPIDKLSLPLRLINAPEIILFYLKQFFLPVDFAITYQWVYTQISIYNFFVPLAVDSIITILIILGWTIIYKRLNIKYQRLYIFFTIWLLLGIVFHLQIFPLDQTVADRWFYFSIVGVLGMTGVLLEAFNSFLNYKLLLTISFIILIALSTRTIIRGFDFKDRLTLYTHDAKVSPDSFSLQNVLGLEYMKRGNLKEAKTHIERSIALYPYFSNYDNLGEVYVGLGDYKKAKASYLNALKYGDFYIVYEDLAGLTLVDGDPTTNMQFFMLALRKFPQDVKLWLYLAIFAYQQNQTTIAKQAITRAYQLDKSSPQIIHFYDTITKNLPLDLQINKSPQDN